MIRYNNILRPVHDPPATPHDPPAQYLGGTRPPTPQDWRLCWILEVKRPLGSAKGWKQRGQTTEHDFNPSDLPANRTLVLIRPLTVWWSLISRPAYYRYVYLIAIVWPWIPLFTQQKTTLHSGLHSGYFLQMIHTYTQLVTRKRATGYKTT